MSDPHPRVVNWEVCVYLLRLLPVIVMALSAFAQPPGSLPPLVADSGAGGPVSPGVADPHSVNLENKPGISSISVVPPLPEGAVTLLGGTILHVDHVRDRLVLKVFGGDSSAVLFDERTRVFRDGVRGTTDDLKEGMRAYVDTTLDGTSIFARNVRLVSTLPSGQSSGQIAEINASTGELEVRDALAAEPVKMRLAPNTAIYRGDQAASLRDLQTGTLVSLTFSPGNDGVPRVNRVAILASPGAQFIFAGRIEFLNVSRGLMVVVDPRDHKSYEVNFDPAARALTGDLREGTNVTVRASFDGRRYEAQSITAVPPAAQ